MTTKTSLPANSVEIYYASVSSDVIFNDGSACQAFTIQARKHLRNEPSQKIYIFVISFFYFIMKL
jgi:hypothetical protein